MGEVFGIGDASPPEYLPPLVYSITGKRHMPTYCFESDEVLKYFYVSEQENNDITFSMRTNKCQHLWLVPSYSPRSQKLFLGSPAQPSSDLGDLIGSRPIAFGHGSHKQTKVGWYDKNERLCDYDLPIVAWPGEHKELSILPVRALRERKAEFTISTWLFTLFTNRGHLTTQIKTASTQSSQSIFMYYMGRRS